ncbi:ABC transporter ATP-binding protein [Tellurirhabdus rosea]|uniref:ABC transporter ATP-binding protein n=1 Tax=Tellurirhabdus rosea TaxID=2674997 RepID=UPI002258601B|nr:ABC transporter ATP-binding protein [Tellurirhabdus rosea]
MLQADQISKFFENTAAVRSVTLEVRPGEVIGLVGESGSGKSTFLNLLAGLADADEGTVRFNGERIKGPSEQLVAGHPLIKLVHQEYQLMPNVSIRENIAYALRYYERTFQDYRVAELLKTCRLEHVADRIPKHVSGGEKQRTAIARALAEKPADGLPMILLLDEPFSHLDLPNRILVRDLLLDVVRHERMGCLFVTHDASDALSISDRLGILQNGRLIQLAPPARVYRYPYNSYAARMTGPANIVRAKQLPALGVQHIFHPNAAVCIRPEQLRLNDRGAFGGIVQRVLFKGLFSEVDIEVNRQTTLTALATYPTELSVGQVVGLDLLGGVHWLKDL